MEGQKIKPTVEWMAAKYDQFNRELFGGTLGQCEFEVFTTGKGSRGRAYGWFSMKAPGLGVKSSGRMYNRYTGDAVTAKYFVQMCAPVIALNGNYSWTEGAMENTLIHEMCHYYTYKDGYCPRQAHGPEFRQIAAEISARSNGRITIQRLASAEKMANTELDADIAAANQRRLDKKKASVTAVIAYMENGTVELSLTSSGALVDEIIRLSEHRLRYGDTSGRDRIPKRIITSNDPNLIEKFFSCGYRKNLRTYRFWNIEKYPWVFNIESEYQVNVRLAESVKRTLSMIIEDVVNNFVADEDDKVIPITPDMNLGEMSPLEANT